MKGKIAYMSPEQAHGTVLDRRCDVWAAGVVAWEIFAGKRLHAHDDDVATLLKVATLAPPPLRSVAPDVPEAIEAAVAGALEMEIERRHATAEVFATALAEACRATIGLADRDDVASWMAQHVQPRVSGQRLQAARSRSLRHDLAPTRVETPVHSGPTDTVQPMLTHEDISLYTATANPAPIDTVLLPTVSAEPGTRPLTDAVSVVTRRWRTTGSVAVARRARIGGAIGAAVLLVVAIVAWRVSASREPTAPTADPAASAALLAAPISAAGGSSGPSLPTAPPRTLRLRANALIASVRVNDRAAPLTRAGTTVDVRLAELGLPSTLSIDAVAVDGRRAAVVVPGDATDVSLEFPARGALPSPARPAAVRSPVASPAPPPAAPLAPSPY